MILWKKPAPAAPKKTAAQYILGVSVSAEGAAAAMLRDGKVIFSAYEPPPAGGAAASFPSAVVSAALEKASEAENVILGVQDMAAVAFCGKPLAEYARLRSEWMALAPAGFGRFMVTAPGAFVKKRLGEGLLARELAAVSWGEVPALTLYPEHQLACAASAFYASPFEDSAILSLDGPGEGPAAAVCMGSGEKIKVLRELLHPDSPQLLSGALAAYAGYGGEAAWELFTAPEAADKERAGEFYRRIVSELAELREDGSVRLSRRYFSEADGMRPDLPRWRKLFGLGPGSGGELEGERLDFAAAARAALEELVYRLGAQAKRLSGSNNLCLCAPPELKLAAEGKLKAAGLFVNIWSQPYSAPESKAAGAALAARHIYFGIKRPATYPRSWGEPVKQELPEESAPPFGVNPPRPLSAAARLGHAAYFWLYLTPAAAAARLSTPGEKAAAGSERASFYVARARIYAREDLEGAGAGPAPR